MPLFDDTNSPCKSFTVLQRIRHFATQCWDALHHTLKKAVFRPRQLSLLAVNSLLEGGAARAAWRTFFGVRHFYPDARFLTLYRTVKHPAIEGLGTANSAIASKLARQDRRLLRRYPHHKPDVFFSPGILYSPVRRSLAAFKPDILHLNWIAGGMMRVEELADVSCPIVWTLHDAWAFTGGCHYAGACSAFADCCGSCPALGSSKKHDLSYSLMKRKQALYPRLNLTIVSPSRWLAEEAKRSYLLKSNRVEVIPNGVDLSVFKPMDHHMAKSYFNLPDEPVLLFGSCNLADPRKGGDLLRSALSRLESPCTLLTFGDGQLDLPDCPQVHTRSLGRLYDDQSLALAYSAADVFCCPSREDNFPNTVVESMACGTPCLAFREGGLPEMIDHRENGWLAEAGDSESLAQGIRWLTENEAPATLRMAARRKAEAEFGLELMAERYHNLFEELKGQASPASSSAY